jgi:hypothetical protein
MADKAIFGPTYVTLATLSGEPVWIVQNRIVYVRRAETVQGQNATCIGLVGGDQICVAQAPEEVLKLLQ